MTIHDCRSAIGLPVLLGGVIMAAGVIALRLAVTYQAPPAASHSIDGGSVMRVIGGHDDFTFIRDLKILNGILIVIDSPGGESIKLVDPASGRLIATTGRSGWGPGELQSPVSASISNDSMSFWVFDSMLGRIIQFTMDSVLTVNRTISTTELIFHHEWRGDTLYANGFDDRSVIGFYSEVAGTLKRQRQIGMPPVADVQESIGRHLNRNIFALSADGETFATAFMYVGLIRLLTNDGTVVADVKVGGGEAPRFSRASTRDAFRRTRETRWYFIDLERAGDVLLALYSGRNERENPHESYRGTKIYAVSWRGELVDSLVLQEGLETIAFEPHTGHLYGTRSDPYPAIVEVDWARLACLAAGQGKRGEGVTLWRDACEANQP